jgi:hypothetical protein
MEPKKGVVFILKNPIEILPKVVFDVLENKLIFFLVYMVDDHQQELVSILHLN